MYQVGQQGRTRRVEEVGQRRLDEDHGVEVLNGQRIAVEEVDQSDRDEGDPTDDIDDDDGEATVPAVDEDTARQAEDEHRQELDEVSKAQVKRGARELQHQP